MDGFVARENIAHFRKLLGQETDEAKRRQLLKMLAEEEAKLEAAEAKAAERKQG